MNLSKKAVLMVINGGGLFLCHFVLTFIWMMVPITGNTEKGFDSVIRAWDMTWWWYGWFFSSIYQKVLDIGNYFLI